MHKYKSLQAGQLPQEHLPFLQNLLDFTITKYLKQEGDDDLRVCMDERSPCGLSITGDIHVMKRKWCNCPQWRSALSMSIQSCFYCPNLITVAPL